MGIATTSVADHNTGGWRFDSTYARLPDVLFVPSRPATVQAPRVSILNHRLADELGLDLGVLRPEAAAALFAGQDLPDGSRPIAQAYAGHQFGHFTMLGDGKDDPNCRELGGDTHGCSPVALTPEYSFAITVGGLNVRDVKAGKLLWRSPGFAPRGCVTPALANGWVF
jgi:hypothetical protein